MEWGCRASPHLAERLRALAGVLKCPHFAGFCSSREQTVCLLLPNKRGTPLSSSEKDGGSLSPCQPDFPKSGVLKKI